MGRPKADIDAVVVEKLARLGCTEAEIAGFCGVGETTIRRRFGAELSKGRVTLKRSLRRKQLQVALKQGNVAMLIWLGKQYLDQAEKSEIQQETRAHVFDHGRAVAALTPGPMEDREPSGAHQGGGDGPALGEDVHGG